MADDVVAVEATETSSTADTQSEPTLEDLAAFLEARMEANLLPQVQERIDKSYQAIQSQLTPLQQLRAEVRELTGNYTATNAQLDALMKAQLGAEDFNELKERIASEQKTAQAEARAQAAEAKIQEMAERPAPTQSTSATQESLWREHYLPLWRDIAAEEGLTFDSDFSNQDIAGIKAKTWAEGTQQFRALARQKADALKAESARIQVPQQRSGAGSALTEQSVVNKAADRTQTLTPEEHVILAQALKKGIVPKLR